MSEKEGVIMSIITISRQMGSRGAEIAQAVPKEINYEYMDKNKIAEALRKYGLQSLGIETFDEKNRYSGIICPFRGRNTFISSRP